MLTKYVLRINTQLYKALQEKALEESRSVNNLITLIIKEYLNK